MCELTLPYWPATMRPNLKELPTAEIDAWLGDRGEPGFRARQIRRWLFQRGATSFAEMRTW